MILATFLFFVASQAYHQISKPEATQGSSLFHDCEAAVAARPSESDAARGSRCLSYIEGFVDGKDVAGKGPCATSASFGDMAVVYVAWMKKHPDAMSMDKRVGMVMALGQAYPCPKQ